MRMKLERSPYKHLLDDPKFRKWLENVERGSVNSASEYLRRIGYVCREFDTTTEKLASMDGEGATNLLLDLASYLEKKGSTGTNAVNYMKALRAWWRFNRIVVTMRVKVSGANTGKYDNERVPTKEELGRILNAADMRAKVAISLMAFGGCRDGVLGTRLGDDGLMLSDLPELSIKDGSVTFSKTPTLVKVRRSISKTKNSYLTFLPEEACDYLQQYLEWRLKNGEELGPTSPVVTAFKYNRANVGHFISTPNIGDLIRKPIRDGGFQWRPYVLRRYFDMRMMEAESEGLTIRDWRVFWMGHKGDIEATYTVSKGVPDDMLEKMRAAYGKASDKHLATRSSSKVGGEERISALHRQVLKLAGYSDEDLAKLDVPHLSDTQVEDLLAGRGEHKTNGRKQERIPFNLLDKYLADGWEYVTSLPNQDVIVRSPE